MPRPSNPSAGWLGCKATPEFIAEVDELGRRAGLNRSELIRLALVRLAGDELPPALLESAPLRRAARLTTPAVEPAATEEPAR